MIDFDDFSPDWDDIALAAAILEEFGEDERRRIKRRFIDETLSENEEDEEDQI